MPTHLLPSIVCSQAAVMLWHTGSWVDELVSRPVNSPVAATKATMSQRCSLTHSVSDQLNTNAN